MELPLEPPGPAVLAEAPFDAREAFRHQRAWAARLETEVEVANSVGMKLRLIPPG
mgnify:CR=1 FL=1